jgi:hypothetical protein
MLAGGCHCGATRFEVREVFDAGYCHCNRCRKRNGAPVTAFLTTPASAFAIVAGEAWPDDRAGRQHVCSECGADLHFAFQASGTRFASVPLGLLDDPNAVRPKFHQWTEAKLTWLEIADTLPRYPRGQVAHPRRR